MNILKDDMVQKYLSSLDGMSPIYYVDTDCQCIKENIPLNAHSDNAKPFSSNMAELSVIQGQHNIRLVTIYITKTSYFVSETMQYFINEMLNSKNIETVEQYYNVLDTNFMMHPPCAPYMHTEYRNLMLTPFKKFFKEMALWDYLVHNFHLITSKSLSCGDNKVFDLAFKRCLSFCIRVLQFDFEVSKKTNQKPLIMMCLKYNPKRKRSISVTTKLLRMLFNTGYDLQMPVIHLALLVEQMMK